MMQIALAIDALSNQLTGIGRYAWHLSQGLAMHPTVESVRYYRDRRWFDDASSFLTEGPARRNRVPRFLRRLAHARGFRGRIFHAPNYLLPLEAERPIVTVHDLSVFHYPQFHPAVRVQAFERNFWRSLGAASHIITDSEWIRRELGTFAQIPLDRITAVPLGVEPAFFRDSQPQDGALLARYGLAPEQYVLCVATLEPRKSLEKAVAAFEDYAERHATGLKLAIAGADGWQDGPLRAQLEGAQRRGRVVLLGFIEDRYLPAIYANARLFLFPSVYEGFGLPPVEAMAAGVPTIVSNRSCLPEVMQGAAMLIEPDDMRAFSDAIARGLEDDSWRASSIEKGKRVARGYTWRRCVDETVNVYRKV